MSVSRKFDSIEAASADLRAGKMVILIDDEDRENEGDLVLAAQNVTPEAINFMARAARGLICLALTPERCDQLDLPQMVAKNTSGFETGFTVSIEAKKGVTTGISAADRAKTILTAIDPESTPDDLARPGHVFPLRARPGGTLERVGQTEGSIDLLSIAGLYPAAVLCEIMKDDGSMARVPDLLEFARAHEMRIITVQDIARHRLRSESLVRRAVETTIPTDYGQFNLIAYEDIVNQQTHLALYIGQIDDRSPVLTRVHSQCMTGDVFGSRRCDCGEQLDMAMNMIATEKRGVLLYLFQEGRGIGLINKLKAYNLQDSGRDTVEANQDLGFKPDLRDYGIGAQILRDLGARRLKLITNNPRKIVGLDGYGLQVVSRAPAICAPRATNHAYLRTKRLKLGHLIEGEPKEAAKRVGARNGDDVEKERILS